MGRHSAPDAEDEADGAPAALLDVAPETAAADRRGRHSRTEDEQHTGPVPGTRMRPADERAAAQDERPTEQLTLAEIAAAGGAELEAEAAPAEPPAEMPAAAEPPMPTPAPPAQRRGVQSTGADLALIRQHPEVRNRVVGAAVAPFVLYAAVLLLLAASGVQYLLWIWIPMVTAGVLIGFILDAGHKRYPGAEGE